MPANSGGDSDATWLFAECRNRDCRFRFPAEAVHGTELQCPRCQSPLIFTPTLSSGSAQPSHRPEFAGSFGAMLDNIRSIHNVGSMFRTADGAGLDHLYLCGITATPEQPRLAKAALGAQESIAWSYHPNASDLAESLIADEHQLWGLERVDAAEPTLSLPEQIPPNTKVILVAGNEKAGVDPTVLRQCKRTIGLPMTGHKNSLNVAVAFGIAVYALRFGAASPPDNDADGSGYTV